MSSPIHPSRVRRLLRPNLLFAILVFAFMPVWAGPIGVFQGELVDGPHAGWLYVKGHNGLFRRVQIGKSRIAYANSVPANLRAANPIDGLTRGAVVRITAEQGPDGEWMAREIILVHAASSQRVMTQNGAALRVKSATSTA